MTMGKIAPGQGRKQAGSTGLVLEEVGEVLSWEDAESLLWVVCVSACVCVKGVLFSH